MKTKKREFTARELARYDGRRSPKAFVACNGKVYDVSGSFLWQGGAHQVVHHAGRDLTRQIAAAPHGEDLLRRFRVVGTLAKNS